MTSPHHPLSSPLQTAGTGNLTFGDPEMSLGAVPTTSFPDNSFFTSTSISMANSTIFGES